MKPEDIKLTDGEVGEIAKQYDGRDYELSMVGMPVYKNLGDDGGRHRAIVQGELKKVVGHINPRLTPHYKEGEQDGWYMPYWFWQEIKKIAGVKED